MLNYSNKVIIKHAFIIEAWARGVGQYMANAYNKQVTTLGGAIDEVNRLKKTIPNSKRGAVYFTIKYRDTYIKYIEA